MINRRGSAILLILFLVVILINDVLNNYGQYHSISREEYEERSHFVNSLLNSTSDRIPHANILLNSNQDLINQSITENWTGEGTKSNPYVITSRSFDGSNQTYENRSTNPGFIDLANIDLYLVITNCTFKNSWTGYGAIRLQNVSNCQISNNLLINEHYRKYSRGISIEESTFLILCNNTIAHWEYGIDIYRSTEIKVIQNVISINDNGISFILVEYLNISHNTLFMNSLGGTFNYSVIEYNTITGGYDLDAIRLYALAPHISISNSISHNLIKNNNGGISLGSIIDSNVSHNRIHSNARYGIELGHHCSRLRIFNNEILYNTKDAIKNYTDPDNPNTVKIYNNIIFPENLADLVQFSYFFLLLLVLIWKRKSIVNAYQTLMDTPISVRYEDVS